MRVGNVMAGVHTQEQASMGLRGVFVIKEEGRRGY